MDVCSSSRVFLPTCWPAAYKFLSVTVLPEDVQKTEKDERRKKVWVEKRKVQRRCQRDIETNRTLLDYIDARFFLSPLLRP